MLLQVPKTKKKCCPYPRGAGSPALLHLTVPCSSSGAWAEIMDFLLGKCHLGTIPQLLWAATAWGDHPRKGRTHCTNTGCAEKVENPKINPTHILWELPQETKVQNNCKIPNAGTDWDNIWAFHLGTSTATTLEGSEIPVQSHEVTVTVLRGFISPYNNPVVQHGSGAVLSLLTKPQVSVKEVHFYHIPVTSPQSFIHVSDSCVAPIICWETPHPPVSDPKRHNCKQKATSASNPTGTRRNEEAKGGSSTRRARRALPGAGAAFAPSPARSRR